MTPAGTAGRAGAPGPDGRHMLRSVPLIRRDAPAFLTQCRARWGDIVEFPIPRRRTYLVSAPDAVRRVLQDNSRNYDKATVQYRALSLVTGRGLLTSDGQPWRRQRRLVQPAFHSRTLAAVAARSADAAGRTLARWDTLPDGSAVDADLAMMEASLDVVGHALFGTDLAAGQGPGGRALVAAVLDALEVVVARARFPLPVPLAVPTPRNRRLRRSLRLLDGTVLDTVGRRRHADGRRREPADLLDLLLRAADGGYPGAAEGDSTADRQLRDEIVTLLIAGHETVASALTWTWHLLAGDPDVRTRVEAEVDAVLAPSGAPRLPFYDDLPSLVWTRAALDEALRLYPPAWVLTRRAIRGDTLGGYAIPAGSLVLVSPWVLHRHPDVWADPDRFDPSRFLPRRREEVPRHAYLPFGAGPRQCVGREFALVEGTVLLAALAARYRLDRTPGIPVRPAALVTVRPQGGLAMRLRRRRSRPSLPVPAASVSAAAIGATYVGGYVREGAARAGRGRHAGTSVSTSRGPSAMTDSLRQLSDEGVAIWLDDMSRGRLVSGNLKAMVRDKHVVGVTTNPTIFHKAISSSDVYDQQVHDLAALDIPAAEAIRLITTHDVRAVCDLLRPVYDATDGLDGRVSIEVDPRLAHDTDRTIAEAHVLWWLVDRPNVMIKIPATREGLPAITRCLSDGISVNVTLIFSLDRYQEVMEAYLAGLEGARAAGRDLSRIASVASFFVSRVDTEVDERLDKIGSPEAAELRGKAAIANARLAYQKYEEVFCSGSQRWEALEADDARTQRPLWASTGVKDPSYDDTRYVVELVAAHTVNTMPEPTLDAVADHGTVRGDTVRGTYAQARRVLDDLAGLGIDYDEVVAALEVDGVAKFQASWTELLESVSSALSGRSEESTAR